MDRFLAAMLSILLLSGCSAIPDVTHQPQYHNPFPQLSRVAVLPFFNQSADATVDADEVALAYYNELQAIRGFEVVPVGVTKQKLLASLASGFTPSGPEDFQRLAQEMGVDAIVVGSVTEFSPYYPPRMGLSVRWYAANPGFHPIPPGYGLPWGTAAEEFIPEDLVFEAEFALAKEQLKTQSPESMPAAKDDKAAASESASVAAAAEPLPAPAAESSDGVSPPQPLPLPKQTDRARGDGKPALPPDWPDPRGFVPPAPATQRPPALPQSEPVMTHTRLYHGNDGEFTRRLANYYYYRDDARFGDWPGYLQRSDDFIRFCCHLHITEMLTARGGAGETRVVWRWPIRRYER